jgi:hypothetical protein
MSGDGIDQRTAERLADGIDDLNRNLTGRGRRGSASPLSDSSNSNSGSGKKDSGGSGVMDRFAELAGGATGALKGVWEGSAKVADGFHLLTGVIEKNGGVLGKAFGSLAEKVGDSVLDTHQKYLEFSQYGAGFNNNLGEMDRLVKGARMTHDEYGDMLRKNAQELNGIGSTMNRSQVNFLEFTKGLQESDVVNKLKEFGLQTEDVTEVAKAAMAHQRGIDMSDLETKNAAIDSAIRMTAAMEETTRVTGLSRKAQEDDLKKQMENAQVQVALSRLDKDAQNRYQQSITEMQGLPEAAKRVFQETFTGGLRTKEGAESMAAMGTAGPELQKAAEAMKAATTDDEKKAAQIQMQKAIEASNAWMNSDGFKDMVQYGKGGVATKATESWQGASELKQIQTKIAEEKNKGNEIDEATARRMIREEAHNNSMGKDEKGEKLKDTEVATTLNKANSTLKDMAAGASKTFGEMVRTGNDFVKEWDGINGILRARKQEEATPGALLKEATGVFKSPISIGDANRKANEEARKGATQPSDADAAKSPAKHFFADGTPEFEKFLSGGGGFKDMFTHFDPKGELAELHGNEIVANEDQMKRFVQQMMPPMSPSAEQRQSKSSTPSTTDVKDATKLDQVPATPQLTDISKTFTDINTEMKGVAKQFNEIADKFKNITFAPQAKEMHETVTKAIEKATPQIKTAEVKPVEPPKAEVKAEVKPVEPPKAETKPAEVKPAESKQSEIANAEAKNIAATINANKAKEEKTEQKPADNPFKLVEQQSIAQLGQQFNKLIKPATSIEPPKIITPSLDAIKSPKSIEDAATTALHQNFEHLSKAVAGPLNAVKEATAEKTKATVQQPVKPKAPDVSQLDASLLNLAKFKQSMNSGDISKIGMSQMDLSDSGKAAEDKLGPSAARMALQKKREALEDASFSYEEMKASNTKPSAEFAENLAKQKAEVAKLALAYEDDLIKTKGKLKLHAEEEAKNAELKNKTAKEAQAKQVAQALESEKQFMKEHGATAQSSSEKSKVTDKPIKEMTDAEKNFAMYSSGNKLPPPEPEGIHSPKDPKFDQLREQLGSSFKSLDATIKPAGLPKLEEITTKYEPPKEEPKEKGFFDSISDTFSDVGSSIASVFKGDNKPGFAKGNVKYEEISQEEKDAADKRSQEGIGKVDHSPEATAARIAELNRQHSSYYKQKPDIKDDKSKEPAKIDDKSKVEPLKADIKPPVETKEQAHVKEMYKKFGLETFNDYNTRISAEVKQSHASIKDVKKDHATITSQDVKQPKPVEQPKAAEPIKPATPPPAAPAPVSKDVTLKDLHEALMQLNKTMTQMVHHTDTISNNSHKQIKATKSLSDNRLG